MELNALRLQDEKDIANLWVASMPIKKFEEEKYLSRKFVLYPDSSKFHLFERYPSAWFKIPG